MPDTDFELAGGGGGGSHPEEGGAVSKEKFLALRASVWSKNKEGEAGAPGPLPWIRHCNVRETNFNYFSRYKLQFLRTKIFK